MKNLNKKNEFHHVIVASIQDMKNSLNILQHTLEKMPVNKEAVGSFYYNDALALHYEVARMQNSTAQLHSLFLLENNELSLQLVENYLQDVVEEKIISHARLFQCLDVDITVEVDEGLYVYADSDLLAQVIDIAIVSAARYSKGKITIQAKSMHDGALISVEDNGQGYPDLALQDFAKVIKEKSLAELTNQTLAWYFCYSIAKMHHIKRRHGWVKLSNDSQLGGSLFEIFIP